jgi:dTMP kinase
MIKRGLFIVFEGIDGGGKSTQINLLKNFLEIKGYKVKLTSEPTDDAVGSLIRNYAGSNNRNLIPETEALLFAADRVEHSKNIEKDLKNGFTVICDRYIHSSLAYQNAAGVNLKWIRTINKLALKPDLVILLDIDPEISLQRVCGRKRTIFEEKAYLCKVRKIYLELAEHNELVIVDASKSIEKVHNDVLEKTRSLIDNFGIL